MSNWTKLVAAVAIVATCLLLLVYMSWKNKSSRPISEQIVTRGSLRDVLMSSANRTGRSWPDSSFNGELDKRFFMARMKKRMNERRAKIRDTCIKFDLQQNVSLIKKQQMVDENYRIVHCNIGKTGSTRWKQMFWQLKGHNLQNFTVQRYKQTTIGEVEIKKWLRNPEWMQSIVVREPFERIISAYRQKLRPPSPEFPRISRAIRAKYGPLRDGKFAAFSDFVHYLVAEAPRSIQTDDHHWDRYTHSCMPCSVDYDFVGKQETIDEDAKYFLELIGAPTHIKHGPPPIRRTDATMSLQYFANVRPREHILALYKLFLPDYIMFDYPPPLPLRLLFGNGSKFWQ